MLRHFLGALAYRTQKALQGAPDDFGDFEVGSGVRTPRELVHHMTGVMAYARACFGGEASRPAALPSLQAEIQRFHAVLQDLSAHLASGDGPTGVTLEQLVQGPFADAMTHAGQLAMLRRLHGTPVTGENFMKAKIDAQNLGADQPLPGSPPDRADSE